MIDKKPVKKEKIKRHWCVYCHQLVAEEYMFFGADPYQLDINEDETPVWECEACRDESSMEI